MKSVVWAILVLVAFLVGSGSAASATPSQSIESHTPSFGSELAIDVVAMREELQALVEKWGLEIEDFNVSVSVSSDRKGDYGTTSSCEGCTITVTISIPGGTGMTVSATASDCLGAWSKITQLAKEIGGSIGELIPN